MALSISYKNNLAYTVPTERLKSFLMDSQHDNLIVTLFNDNESRNITFVSKSKIEKKIIWDLIKIIFIFIDELNKKGSLAEVRQELKQNIAEGLSSTNNSLNYGDVKETYISFIRIIKTIFPLLKEVRIDINDIVSSSNQANYKVIIPCQLI